MSRVLLDVVVVQTWVVAAPRQPHEFSHYEIVVVPVAIVDRENRPETALQTTDAQLYQRALAMEGTRAVVSVQCHAHGRRLWLDALA